MLQLPTINPLHTTAMHFFDLGDVESPDGRSHPITATTPVSLVTSTVPATTDISGSTPMQNVGIGSLLPSIPSLPKHIGARLAISVLAIGILLIVAFRLAK